MLSEAPEQRSLTQFGARPAVDTWLRPDLVVARHEQFRKNAAYVTGAPLLVVEVTSAASAARDLGVKKELWARFGVPSYWVVHCAEGDIELHVFELEDGVYVQRARLVKGEALWATEPFKIELSPDEIFDRLPRTLAADWRGTMPINPGPDLPPADSPIDVDVFGSRWPTAAEKVELEDGCPVFYGAWDQRDVEIAQRAYPGRVVLLDQPAGRHGTLRVLPGPTGDRPVFRAAMPELVGFAEAAFDEEVSDEPRKTPAEIPVIPRRVIRIDVPGE